MIILIFYYFMCMVVLVLKITYDQVYSFGPCLILGLDNWRRQVNVASWSTRFHLLFELPPLNFRIHMNQIT
jgi:hypothetical protein